MMIDYKIRYMLFWFTDLDATFNPPSPKTIVNNALYDVNVFHFLFGNQYGNPEDRKAFFSRYKNDQRKD